MMYATAQISVDQRKALAIPATALQHLGEHKVVFIQKGESEGKVRFERVPVGVDERDTTSWLEVKHGLERGQKIVAKGADTLLTKL